MSVVLVAFKDAQTRWPNYGKGVGMSEEEWWGKVSG